MSQMTDMLMLVLMLGGTYYLIQSGKLNEILQGAGLPPLPFGGGGGGAPTGGGDCGGGQSCGTSNAGARNECEGISGSSYEATWCGDFSGDDLSIKLWGPKHSDGNCCWCIVSVSPDGKFGMRQEGPHPQTSSKSGGGQAIGKPSCVKAVISQGGNGAQIEAYGFVNGQWKHGLSYSGPCGYKKKSSSPASNQQISFRCDGKLNTKCATVRSGGSGSSNYASTYIAQRYTRTPSVARLSNT